MANEEHIAILKQGVEVWNNWRQENPDIRPDLSTLSLSESILASDTMLSKTSPAGTWFTGVNF